MKGRGERVMDTQRESLLPSPYAVWTVHCLNREKFENGEKTTRIFYAYQRGKTELYVLEHSFDGPQQVHTDIFSSLSYFFCQIYPPSVFSLLFHSIILSFF